MKGAAPCTVFVLFFVALAWIALFVYLIIGQACFGLAKYLWKRYQNRKPPSS